MRLIDVLRLVFSILLACAGALLALPLLLLPPRWRRQSVARAIVLPCSHAILRLWGVRLRVHGAPPWPTEQTVYVSNHTSTLDVFILTALGLPQARYFLSGYLRKLPPIGILGMLSGVFWTVPQAFPERRREIFSRAAATLRASGESVFLSPEGERVIGGQVGPFNRGAFHLAISLGADIVPLFIVIPQAIDPGRGLVAGRGTVDVHVFAAIPTAGLGVDDVDALRTAVRERYLAWNAEYRGSVSA